MGNCQRELQSLGELNMVDFDFFFLNIYNLKWREFGSEAMVTQPKLVVSLTLPKTRSLKGREPPVVDLEKLGYVTIPRLPRSAEDSDTGCQRFEVNPKIGNNRMTIIKPFPS